MGSCCLPILNRYQASLPLFRASAPRGPRPRRWASGFVTAPLGATQFRGWSDLVVCGRDPCPVKSFTAHCWLGPLPDTCLSWRVSLRGDAQPQVSTVLRVRLLNSRRLHLCFSYAPPQVRACVPAPVANTAGIHTSWVPAGSVSGVASKAQVRDAVDGCLAAEMLRRTRLKCTGRGECPAAPFKAQVELLLPTSVVSLKRCGKVELGMPSTRGTVSVRPRSTVIRTSSARTQSTYGAFKAPLGPAMSATSLASVEVPSPGS